MIRIEVSSSSKFNQMRRAPAVQSRLQISSCPGQHRGDVLNDNCGGACSIGAMLPCKQPVAGASPVSSTILFPLRAGLLRGEVEVVEIRVLETRESRCESCRRDQFQIRGADPVGGL